MFLFINCLVLGKCTVQSALAARLIRSSDNNEYRVARFRHLQIDSSIRKSSTN